MRKLKFKKSLPKWKKERGKKRKAQFKDFIIRLVTILIFLAFLIIFFNLWQNFKKSKWDSRHQLNFVIQSKDIAIYSYNPKEKLLNRLEIKNNTYLPVSKGFGSYPAGNIYKLGEMEDINGGKLLSLSFQELLAVPIDAHIVDKSQSISGDFTIKSHFLKLLFCRFKKQCSTNLTIWDLYRLSNKIGSLKPSQINSIDFNASNYNEKEILPDGSEIQTPNFQLIDRLSIEYFSDFAVAQEGLTVSVFNGTNKPGLANKTGRFINNIGAKLIYTGDETNKQDNTVLYYKDDSILEKYTLKKFLKTLEIKRTEKKDIAEDISILIGNDFIFHYQ